MSDAKTSGVASSRGLAYAFAVGAATVVLLIRAALAPWLEDAAPLILFLSAVMAAGWYGGFGPGLLATVLGALFGTYFLVAAHPANIIEPSHVVRLIIFSTVGLFMSGLCESLHRARRRSEWQAGQIIAERKRTEEALREADRRKDEFLATLAHELRNPLAPITNALQILRFSTASEQQRAIARDIIDRQVRQLTRLVDDLLDVSRITRGKLSLRKQRVELQAIISPALEASRPLIDASSHVLEVALPVVPVFLDADTTRLAQVFSNLLNNAARYTEPGGRIALSAQVDGGEVIVRVRDSGIGIPPEALPRVFEMFTQIDRPQESAQSGLGIGLTLVRRLVDLHGGRIEAHSDGEGMGSEFIVHLPCDDPSEQATRPPSAEPPNAAPLESPVLRPSIAASASIKE